MYFDVKVVITQVPLVEPVCDPFHSEEFLSLEIVKSSKYVTLSAFVQRPTFPGC
jgi:hypothetical protein